FGCATPVIAFNTGGMPDIIIPEISGKLAKPFDSINLGDKILEMINNPEKTFLMGVECRKMVENKFSLRNQAENYLDVYKDIIITDKQKNINHFDFYINSDYDVEVNLGIEKNFKKNNIFKNSFDIYKNLYSLVVSNQRILNSYSYKFGTTLFHPEKLFNKVFRFLDKRIKSKLEISPAIPNLQKDKKIHVLFDHQIFNLQTHGGISRYFTEIFNCFRKMDLINLDLPIIYSNNYYLRKNNKIIKNSKSYNFVKNDIDSFFPKINFKGKRKLYYILKKLGLIKSENYYKLKNKRIVIRNLKRQEYDVFHPTYYNEYFLKFLDKKPFVLTIHDMIHEIFSDQFPLLKDETAAIKKQLALKASKIIAVSENTKRDIIKFYGIDENKIKVIYHATSLKVNKDISVTNFNLPKKYILFVGDRNNYKNFCFFVHSISTLLRDDPDLYLISAGGSSFSNEEIFFLKGNFLEKKVIQMSFDDDILSVLYNNALCFAFPSLYEGFGIPILEAFSCGCPICISNSSCFPEIAGDAAIYYDPYSEKSIKESIEKLIYDESLRRDLISKGYERLKGFDWQKTSVETAMVYESLIRGY
ncbi:MAG TPA: glycosyltransferase, partial [Spirochaetota bacterium]|nr:glycosyltransferase [Spirochaetota bacterium]